MYDYMPLFKQILDTSRQREIDLLCQQHNGKIHHIVRLIYDEKWRFLAVTPGYGPILLSQVVRTRSIHVKMPIRGLDNESYFTDSSTIPRCNAASNNVFAP